MNRSFMNESVKNGIEYLDKKISNHIKKSSTSSTSSNGAGSRLINSALIRHLPSTELKIDQDSLVETFKTKEGTRSKLLIESKAAEILKESLQGFLVHEISSQTWHKFVGTHWQPLESAQLADSLFVDLIYKGTGDLGFRPAYKMELNHLLSMVTCCHCHKQSKISCHLKMDC